MDVAELLGELRRDDSQVRKLSRLIPLSDVDLIAKCQLLFGGRRTPWLSPSRRRGKNKLSEETNLNPNAAVNVDDKIVEISLIRTPRVNPPKSKSSTTNELKMAPMILDRKLNLYGRNRMLLTIT